MNKPRHGLMPATRGSPVGMALTFHSSAEALFLLQVVLWNGGVMMTALHARVVCVGLIHVSLAECCYGSVTYAGSDAER